MEIDTLKDQSSRKGFNAIFKNGSRWFRADFHLHTNADKEFKFDGDDGEFYKQFIERLQTENIGVGLITNHNKFNKEDYKKLAKKARKDAGIYLLPGVELSVDDGNSGLHCLISFDPETWLSNDNDFINKMLSSAFDGIANHENENTNCNWSFKELLEKLENHRKDGRDSFIIMAHIEDPKGFYKELGGGRIEELKENQLFKHTVLGFQKVRTKKVLDDLRQWFGAEIPCCMMEGSDCKKIEQVAKPHQKNGEKQYCYVKLGDFNFEAVKFALFNHEQRVKNFIPDIENAFLESISFFGGLLDGQTISLNPNMNNFIGIRGSGKSTLLELVRYTLDIPFSSQAEDQDYKEGIVKHFLGSGGKSIVNLRSQEGKEYQVQRILGENPEVYEEDVYIPQLKVTESLMQVLYFGQKDLSKIGNESFTGDLIDKFFGRYLKGYQDQEFEIKQQIIATVKEIQRLKNLLNKKEQFEEEKAGLEEKIKVFKEKKVDQKLKKQLTFNKDIEHANKVQYIEKSLIDSLRREINDQLEGFSEFVEYQSSENPNTFNKLHESKQRFVACFEEIKQLLDKAEKEQKMANKVHESLINKYEELKEEFAEIKREIDLPDINPDEFLKLSKKLETTKAKLKELDNKQTKLKKEKKKLEEQIHYLNETWNDEFLTLEKQVKKLNDKGLSITMKVSYKSDKEDFKQFLKDQLKGAGLQQFHINKIVQAYQCPTSIYKDLYETSSQLHDILSGGNLLANFTQKFEENLSTFLTYKVPNIATIYYKGENIKHHSLGQRASALILFILSQGEHDMIMIDQPEDDLDNQSIYNDLVKELLTHKYDTQFIFATHNPNIPVLGDCEQIIKCEYENKQISTFPGSIDNQAMQKEIINVMEGGKEAFKRRKEIYQLWMQ